MYCMVSKVVQCSAGYQCPSAGIESHLSTDSPLTHSTWNISSMDIIAVTLQIDQWSNVRDRARESARDHDNQSSQSQRYWQSNERGQKQTGIVKLRWRDCPSQSACVLLWKVEIAHRCTALVGHGVSNHARNIRDRAPCILDSMPSPRMKIDFRHCHRAKAKVVSNISDIDSNWWCWETPGFHEMKMKMKQK